MVLGATMVVPFLITVTSSTTNDFDYFRFHPVPRYFWSENDRFMKAMVPYFNTYRNWNDQMRCYLPGMPGHWTSWEVIGQDVQSTDRIATECLNAYEKDPEKMHLIAKDYSLFSDAYPLLDTVVPIQEIQGVTFMKEHYEKVYSDLHPEKYDDMSRSEKRKAALKLLSKTWELPFESFYNANFKTEMKYPMGFQGWFPPTNNPKYKDYLHLKEAYREQFFTPGVRRKWLSLLADKDIDYKHVADVFPVTEGSPKKIKKLWLEFKAQTAPSSPTIPFALRAKWHQYLRSEEVAAFLKLPMTEEFTVKTFNKLAGTNYKYLEETPFPLPVSYPDKLQKIWKKYVKTRYPLRLTKINPTPEMQKAFQDFMKKEIKHLRIANSLLGTNRETGEAYGKTLSSSFLLKKESSPLRR
jgi:hypothetical protein